MLITVEDDPHALVDLLWIREAWSLDPVGDDLPPLLSDTPLEARTATDASGWVGTWRDAWPAMWKACLQHAGRVRDHSMFEELAAAAVGSAERAELLHQLIGPTWRDEFGDDAFTAEYETWNQARFDALSRRLARPLEEQPERASLPELIAAWQEGLSTIVVIPCVGSFTRVIGEHALLATAETRDDSNRYGQALKQFR
ncbi:MAG: hypothetical protein ABWY30_01035 [Microterricola sp.]